MISSRISSLSRSLKILGRNAPASETNDRLVCYGFRSQVDRTDTYVIIYCADRLDHSERADGGPSMKGNRPHRGNNSICNITFNFA